MGQIIRTKGSRRVGATGMSEAAASRALVVDSNLEVLDEVANSLRNAGFDVATLSEVDHAIETARVSTADVAVVGGDIALKYLSTIAKEADHLLPRDIPVVLTVDSAEQVTSHPELAMRSSDYLLRPFTADELVHRVHTAIHRNQLRMSRRTESAYLRERVRRISDEIRHTNSPTEMVELALRGVGEAMDAETATLFIFDDTRLTCTSSRWQSGEGMVAAPDVGEYSEELQKLGSELWKASGSLAVLDGKSDGLPEHLRGQLPGLKARIDAFGGSGLVLPVGEGARPFGLFWLVADRGQRRWTSAEIALLQHLLGNLAYGMVQGELILAQQQVVERLQELDAAKDGFVATVHHELRTPLSSILGYVELLQDGDAGDLPGPAQRMLGIIERNGQRLSTLVENVLALSVLDAGTELGSARIDIEQLLNTVATDLLPIAGAKNVKVLVLPAPDTQEVLGVWELLARAFVNVLSNAVKFTLDGGSVTARFASDSETVRVMIEDSGIGIPPDELPHLLTRFYRASNSVSAEIPGTGLGLSITAAAVERHGGKLSVESELGVGTTVTVELPRA
ncbi:hypothetical protein GC088_13330 [Arthrobacter sp. JZ12]|uniref:ATP-binding response regulator n=1 Tax=Arthrobacter sp. JZ12 TaxID=2654190 RepID=UPI002B4713F0|nr:ATP-binding protein [Arthrobacter sp. JZ12]WRH25955.1 hypothetical protein GC088_13330 [Arthrobacter sp. JZ12]